MKEALSTINQPTNQIKHYTTSTLYIIVYKCWFNCYSLKLSFTRTYNLIVLCTNMSCLKGIEEIKLYNLFPLRCSWNTVKVRLKAINYFCSILTLWILKVDQELWVHPRFLVGFMFLYLYYSAFVLYALLGFTTSDYPFVSFKNVLITKFFFFVYWFQFVNKVFYHFLKGLT